MPPPSPPPDATSSPTAARARKPGSALSSVLTAGGKPITVNAPTPDTVTLTFAGPSGPGLRMLDQVTILPKHKLEDAYTKGEFGKAWSASTPPSAPAGLAP